MLANVAAYRRKADTMTMPASEWDIMHAVTTRGTFLMMREAIKIMRQQPDGGSIVNVSSVSADHPTVFNNTHYDSAKAGVRQFRPTRRDGQRRITKDGRRVRDERGDDPSGAYSAGPPVPTR